MKVAALATNFNTHESPRQRRLIGMYYIMASEKYHSGWDAWIVDNLARNVEKDRLIIRMIARGFAPEFSTKRVKKLSKTAEIGIVKRYRAERDKLASLLNTLGELQKIDGMAAIDEVSDASAEKLYRYVFNNQPVVLRGVFSDWPAVKKWSPQYFRTVLGELEIEVTADRESDPHFEERVPDHVRSTRFSEFADRLAEGVTTNDFYLVSKNKLLKRPEAAILLDDYPVDESFLECRDGRAEASIWMGPAGTVTPLHHDGCNILFAQVVGRKRVYLISPFYIPRLYNDRSCFSSVDLENPDYGTFPLMKGVPVLSVELGPGDAILLPVCWWHQVRSLEVSISLSFTGFKIPHIANVWPWRREERDGRYS